MNQLPKSLQNQAKRRIHKIWIAPDKDEANKRFDLFIKTYKAKYPKAAECLEKDRDVLLRFYDFPAERWKSIRTTNLIESTFATVRLRTAKVRGCFSAETVIAMAFKLCRSAERRRRKLAKSAMLSKFITGTKFIDGEEKACEKTKPKESYKNQESFLQKNAALQIHNPCQ